MENECGSCEGAFPSNRLPYFLPLPFPGFTTSISKFSTVDWVESEASTVQDTKVPTAQALVKL